MRLPRWRYPPSGGPRHGNGVGRGGCSELLVGRGVGRGVGFGGCSELVEESGVGVGAVDCWPEPGSGRGDDVDGCLGTDAGAGHWEPLGAVDGEPGEDSPGDTVVGASGAG
ncbi:MAG: hypothetical protein JOZ47_08915 [Kutzneria sp.]|nr:hypothetical protein [Kutzneria sp.]